MRGLTDIERESLQAIVSDIIYQTKAIQHELNNSAVDEWYIESKGKMINSNLELLVESCTQLSPVTD